MGFKVITVEGIVMTVADREEIKDLIAAGYRIASIEEI